MEVSTTLTVTQQRRFKRAAKAAGRADHAAKLAFRIGLLVLDGALDEGADFAAVAAEVNAREAKADAPPKAESKEPAKA